MQFLPLPHVLREKEGEFRFRWDTQVVLSERTAPGALLWAGMIRDEAAASAGFRLHILRGPEIPECVFLDEDSALEPDHYRLTVSPDGIRIAGSSDEALLHGVCTLRQWIRRNGAVLPCLEIEDWLER